SYVPRPQGWRDRWVCERPEPAPGAAAAEGAEPPGGGAQVALRGGTLVVDATGLPAGYRQWVTYRNWDLDAGKEEVLRDEFVYNGPHRGAPRAVHDFLVECVLAAEAGDGRFALRLTDGRDRVTAELPVGQAPGPARLVREPGEVLATAEGARLAPGSRAEVTFALFDRRVLFSLDGEEVFGQVDLPEVPTRAEVSRPLQLSAQGAAVAVEGLRLYRDVHYAPVGRHAVREPYRLPAGEYFVLGDNSGNSDDSRWWRTPGVPEESFLGKPFLLHQPSRTARWELFGEPRAVRVIDWGRVRWIR
ncbi:MAG TPA: S26 family signal peptidase, partial [Gemmataceae bacterium]